MPYPLASLDYPPSEIVIGIVYAVGTDTRPVLNFIDDQVAQFGYASNRIRISDLIRTLDVQVDESTPFKRIDSLMTAGNDVCRTAKRADFLALVAASEILQKRKCGSCGKSSLDSIHATGEDVLFPVTHPFEPAPRAKTVHVLYSLKRREEVFALRRIYGSGFYLLGVFASEEDRLQFLTADKGMQIADAQTLIIRDQDENTEYGQNTRNTFALADCFVRVDSDDALEFKIQIRRFLDLIFGEPFITPTPHEYAMFLAFSASLRSADLSRQVGAVIVNAKGELISTGCNDVPKSGGGLYWPGSGDARDIVRGNDSNEIERNRIACEIIRQLKPETPVGAELASAKTLLKDSSLWNITEYGRSVHAEMEALLACTRTGISPREGTLYTTTFPCHNCSRHIVGSGIQRVVYVEPYPKSLASKLHEDSISLGPPHQSGRVKFEAFVGIGPRRYFDLFSTRLSTGYPVERKNDDGTKREWDRSKARVRVPFLPNSYLEREMLAVKEIDETAAES